MPAPTELAERYVALWNEPDPERRVARAYERFVAPGDAAFRPRGTPVQLADVLKFEWEYAPLDGSAPAGGGTEFVLLAADGRIRSDYQFIDG